MADMFSNGLLLVAPVVSGAPAAGQCGRTFARWLVEWLTQVVGWSVVQSVAGNWTSYVSTGNAGATVSALPSQFNIGSSSYTFTTADIGAYITITGFPVHWASRNGIYRIKSIVGTKTVNLEVERCMHEDGLPTYPAVVSGLTWGLWRNDPNYVPDSGNVIVLAGTGRNGSGYTFHLHINVRSSSYCYFPEFRMSPFASWSGGGWIDSRYTSALGIDNWNNSIVNVTKARVWATADTDRSVICLRSENDYNSWSFVYLGEIDVPDVPSDPKACILWSGSNRGSPSVGGDNDTLFGYGYDSSVYSGGRWLAQDNLTTVVGYASFAHSSGSSDTHWLAGSSRVWGEPFRQRYRQSVVCECRTSGYMEMRGTLRRMWFTGRDAPRLLVTGANGEYLHVVGGILLPWFSSKAWYERG